MSWGYLTPPDDVKAEHVRLTQRSSRAGPADGSMPEHRAPIVEELLPLPDPVRCCELLSDLPYRLFLDSAAQGPRLGRYSFLMADPVAVVCSKGLRTECIDFHEPGRAAAG